MVWLCAGAEGSDLLQSECEGNVRMSGAETRENLERVPEGYAAVAVQESQEAAPLRICVLARPTAEAMGGHLVVLRELIDGRVLLGCLVDAGGVVQQWLELWIQDTSGLDQTAAGCRESLTNSVLDGRWTSCFRALEEIDPTSVIRTGWETDNPLPTFLDPSSKRPMHPVDPQSGKQWQLCRDDALLASRKLPIYSNSLHRYLYLPELGEQTPFVAVTAGAPSGESVLAATEQTGGRRGLVPLNPAAGLMFVRVHSPVAFEPFIDLLSGGSWDGVFHGRSSLDLGPTWRALKNSDPALTGGGWLFLGRHGRSGRMVESFHLKLRLLADAVSAVRDAVRVQQRPLLNISAGSFAVRLASPGAGLPFLWTARATLTDPGDAMALPIRTSDAQYFLRAAGAGASVYRPESAGQPVRGRGTVRIRQVLPEVGGATVVEGTFVTQERFRAARYDLIWLRLGLSCGRLDLYGQLEQEAALAAGEWRFRTIPQRFGQDVVAALHAAEGVPVGETPFEIVPLLSTPCDLYSLAVLLVRSLLVNAHTTLPVALDEMISLARQVASTHEESQALGLRIRTLFEGDERWGQSLGPQRLVNDEMAPAEAFDLIPAEVWFDTLGAIVRVLPGIGPDSIAKDYGDAPPGGIHKVFDRVLEDLKALLVRTRSLIVIDWRYNREVHAVIRSRVVGVG